jgi:tetratricopeptide (TPR) repeat protein
VIGAQPEDQPPLLVTAFAWFFQRQVETDPELARGLQFQRLEQLSAAQALAFADLQQSFSRFGADLGGLLAGVGRIEGRLSEMDRKLDEVLAEHRAVRGAVSPRLTNSLYPYERRQVMEFLDKYRALPEAQRRDPVLREKLARLQLGLGDAAGAESGFLEAAAWSGDPAFQGLALFNAYRAALERRDWDTARDHLQRAIDRDSSLSPFPVMLYRLDAILGAGGFGVALRCRERTTGDDNVVVVKALYGDGLLDRPVSEVFQEVVALRRLRHPALIRIGNHGYVDGNRGRGAYIEMEFFAGISLAEWLREHPKGMSVDDVLALFAPVVAAMQEVHAAGLVHRDLSPDNLLLRRDGDR